MRRRLALAIALGGCAGGHAAGDVDAAAASSDGAVDAAASDASYPATLGGARDRLLATYYAWLETEPTVLQSNGLVGSNLHSVCDLWNGLDPSSRSVFLTITDRLYGSILRLDGSHMLDHVEKLYRVIGGQGASLTDPGSCGGGEYNRMIMHEDAELQAAQLAANNDQGAAPYDLADIVPTSFWRNSHDLGGPHAPFDLSDETDSGAPRGQTQYFKDPTSAVANAPLGRMDLNDLVDPYALEMDEDYDCPHNSNPGCSYVFYGPLCAPESSELGTAIFTQDYGDFDPAWTPTGC
ncbi:MAG TPA: hypothetical protein VMJ10_33900 [Kofleriaceae bacterium]|nr:hypothetical protein [Kofleriaceae bacterium]